MFFLFVFLFLKTVTVYFQPPSKLFFNLFQVNTIVFIMVLRIMLNSHKVKQQHTIVKVRTGIKASMIIFPVLGLTWVFGLMTFNRETLFFRYLFAIFNSSQGMLIFLLHCVFNKQVKERSLFMELLERTLEKTTNTVCIYIYIYIYKLDARFDSPCISRIRD